MGKAAFYASKTSCFTGMTLYDTLRKRVIHPKPFGIKELASRYDTLPKKLPNFSWKKNPHSATPAFCKSNYGILRNTPAARNSHKARISQITRKKKNRAKYLP